MNTYTDYFGTHENPHTPREWAPPTHCATGCGSKVADDYGYCWIHKTAFVVAAYKPGLVDALPIKRELRRRMASNDYSTRVMAEVLDVNWRRLTRLLSPSCVWIRYTAADIWFTKLHMVPPAAFWGEAA